MFVRTALLAIIQLWLIDCAIGQAGAPQISSLNVQCDRSGMRVTVNFDSAFNGIIFSKGHYSDLGCRYVQPNTGGLNADFAIPVDKCGTNTLDIDGEDGTPPKRGFENILVFQNDPTYQEVFDHARMVVCRYTLEDDFDLKEKRVVFRPVVIDMLDVVSIPVKDADGQQSRVDCWMEITKGRFPATSPIDSAVKVGSPLTLAIFVRDPRKRTDLRVKDCYAYDDPQVAESNGPALLQLTDFDGCPTKPKLIEVWRRTHDAGPTGATIIAFTTVTAFKFPDRPDLQLTCNIELCRNQCSQRCSSELPGPVSIGSWTTEIEDGTGSPGGTTASTPTQTDEEEDNDNETPSEGGDDEEGTTTTEASDTESESDSDSDSEEESEKEETTTEASTDGEEESEESEGDSDEMTATTTTTEAPEEESENEADSEDKEEETKEEEEKEEETKEEETKDEDSETEEKEESEDKEESEEASNEDDEEEEAAESKARIQAKAPPKSAKKSKTTTTTTTTTPMPTTTKRAKTTKSSKSKAKPKTTTPKPKSPKSAAQVRPSDAINSIVDQVHWSTSTLRPLRELMDFNPKPKSNRNSKKGSKKLTTTSTTTTTTTTTTPSTTTTTKSSKKSKKSSKNRSSTTTTTAKPSNQVRKARAPSSSHPDEFPHLHLLEDSKRVVSNQRTNPYLKLQSISQTKRTTTEAPNMSTVVITHVISPNFTSPSTIQPQIQRLRYRAIHRQPSVAQQKSINENPLLNRRQTPRSDELSENPEFSQMRFHAMRIRPNHRVVRSVDLSNIDENSRPVILHTRIHSAIQVI